MNGTQAGVLGAIGLVLLTVFVRQLLPAGTRTFQLLRRARLAKDADRDVGSASDYHTRLDGPALDDRTWADLDFDEIFLNIDRTVSQVGRQYLYRLLRTPLHDPDALVERDTAVTRLAGDPALVPRIRAALDPLRDYRSAQLVYLMFGELPKRPPFAWLFVLLTAASIGLLIAMPFWPRAFIAWIAVCVLNIGAQIIYKPRLKRFTAAIHEVPKFVRAARTLGALDVRELSAATSGLAANAQELRLLRRASAWLMFEPGQMDELATSIYEYVNIVFLLDVNAFMFAVRALETLRPVMRATFASLGELDALQSIATWRGELAQWTRPQIVEREKLLTAQQVYHPLLERPVANSIGIRDRGVLITGSNMSGKTTFVRTIGVNAVLAQTVLTVCAERWVSPLLNVRTSIGRADSIVEGKSYYLAEAESVRSLIVAKSDGQQHLFLLDEIFRGTNTSERVAAGYAVLRHLNRGDDLVIVATHDVELVGMLGDAYDAYQFREDIGDGTITFDHRIRSGPSSTTNAIAMLGVLGYPSELVADARAQLER